MYDEPYLPRISFPEPPVFPQVGRDNIALLAIETEHCPHVMQRVLGAVTDRKILAFTISAAREGRVQRVEIELARPRQELTRALLNDLLRITNVRRARLLVPSERQQTEPVAAKL